MTLTLRPGYRWATPTEEAAGAAVVPGLLWVLDDEGSEFGIVPAAIPEPVCPGCGGPLTLDQSWEIGFGGQGGVMTWIRCPACRYSDDLTTGLTEFYEEATCLR